MTEPLVTCVMPAYNYGRYVASAIDSVLAQEEVAEAIEIVVVDDGSTDDTAEVVARYGDRVRYVRKENGGLVSTVDRGLAEARGRFVTLLDADDEWLPSKTRVQLELLERKPHVGMVFGDLELIDAGGATTHRSYFRSERVTPRRGNALGHLYVSNCVPGASMMLRAEIVRALRPIPQVAPYPDWWLALGAAGIADIDYVPDPVYRYRRHGSNMGFGVDPDEKYRREIRERDQPFRRWLLANAVPGTLEPRLLVRALVEYLGEASLVTRALGEARHSDWLEIDADERRLAAERLAAARSDLLRGRDDLALFGAVAAAALDPDLGDALDLARRLGPGGRRPQAPSEPPRPLEGLKDFSAVAFADELAQTPELLAAWAREIGGDGTLVVHAPGWDDERTERELAAALAAAGIDDWPDVLAINGSDDDRHLDVLAASAGAVLTRRPRQLRLERLPHADDRRADALHAAKPGVASRPRALVVVDFFHPSVGGAERLAEAAGVALIGCGWEAEVACRALPEREVWAHRDLEVLELARRDPAAELAELVAERAFDAVLAFAPPYAWPLPATLDLPRHLHGPGPRLVVVPCINPEGYALLQQNLAFREDYRRRLAAADVVVSSSEAGFDAAVCRELAVPFEFVPNATDLVEPEGSLRAEHEIPAETPVLLHVANFWPEKNHLGLLRVLRETPGDWRLVLIGAPSPDAPALADEIRAEAALDPRVLVIPGATPAFVAAAMTESDLLLQPSHADATPLVLIEAMSHSLPWVATPNCGSAHDHAGGIVAPVDAFPTLVPSLLADPRARERLGAAGRTHWAACYTWEVVGPRYAKLLAGEQVGPLAAPADAVAETAAVRARLAQSELAA